MSIFDIENKFDKPIEIPYILSKGFNYAYGWVPADEAQEANGTGWLLNKYIDDIDTNMKYYPISKQLKINDLHYNFVKYIPIKTENDFDIAYEYLINLYKNECI